MPRNGSGTYSLPAGNPVTSGATISSTTHNTTMTDVASALTASLAKDGQTAATANLPMGGNKHTNVAAAAARTQYARAAEVQDGSITYLTSVSGADTITATGALSLDAYTAGQGFWFIPASDNTGAVTININSIGAKSIYDSYGNELDAGDLVSGGAYQIAYDGTQFVLLGSVGKVRQVVLATSTTDDAISTTSDSDTSLTASITLSQADSVVIIQAFGRVQISHDTTGTAGGTDQMPRSRSLPSSIVRATAEC